MRSGRITLSCLALALGPSACASCSPDPTGLPDAAPAADAGVEADVAQDVGGDAPYRVCTPPERPSFVPSGWVEYPDYDPCCGFYVPADASQLPPPVAWTSCETPSGMTGCRWIDRNWGGLDSTDTAASLDAQGHVVLLTSRPYADHSVEIVAGADGPVYSALMSAVPQNCQVTQAILQSITAPRWLVEVSERGWGPTNGYIGGTTASIAPTSHRRYANGAGAPDLAEHAFDVGDPGVIHMKDNATIELLDWSTGQHALDITTPAQDSALGQSGPHFFADQLFWLGSAGSIAVIRRWSQQSGPHDFINYNYDPQHPAADMGTDGKDMVWIEAHGPPIDNAFNTTADYWTSPYVMDPADLKPRRLTAEIPNAIGALSMVVGCGLAAAENGLGIRIIRVSDGASWILSNGNGWGWITPLALTCTELFARVASKGTQTIGRVPLSSLGAPQPAQ